MIARDAEPVGNRTPYKRIDLGRSAVRAEPASHDRVAARPNPAEVDRIWRHVAQTASGTAPAPQAPDHEPDVIDYTLLDTDDFFGF